MLRRKWLIGLAVAVVFAGLLGRYLDRVPKRHYCDFRVYHHAAVRMAAGRDIYERDTMAVTPFKYSPFFAFCFIPLGLLPIKAAAELFFAVNFILTIVLFRLAADIAEVRPAVAKAGAFQLLYGLAVLFSLRFIFVVWDSGQVNILMCVLVLAGLVLASKGKDMPAGACLTTAVLIKYVPVIFLPYLLVQKKFKTAGWTLVFTVVGLALPAAVVGLQKEASYLASWMPFIVQTSLDKMSYIDIKNQSLFSMVIRFFSDSGMGVNIMRLSFEQGRILGFALSALLYAMVLMPAKRAPRQVGVDTALLFCCLALFNPNGWEVNFVALIVPFILLIGYLIDVKWKDSFIAACVIGGAVLCSIPARDIAGKTMENNSNLLSNVAIATLLLVAALLKLKFSPPQ